MIIVLVQARDVLGPSSDVDTASAGSQQAAPAVTQEAAGSAVQAEVERPRHAHARGFSYFQPFQSGLQQVCTFVWMSEGVEGCSGIIAGYPCKLEFGFCWFLKQEPGKRPAHTPMPELYSVLMTW